MNSQIRSNSITNSHFRLPFHLSFKSTPNMPTFFGKLFGPNNKSNTFLSNSTRYAYPSNPPLPASCSSLSAGAGLRESVLPPYPHHEFPNFPFGSSPGNRGTQSNGSGAANDIDENADPFSDENRASMSAIRRSRSQTFFSTAQKKLGSLLHGKNQDAGEDNEDSSGRVPTRRRANSTTTRPDPSQFLLTRPLKPKSEPPPPPVRTKGRCPHCDDVPKPASEPRIKENKGKAKAGPSTPSRFVEQNTNEHADFEDNSYSYLCDSTSEEEGGAHASATKDDTGVVRVPGHSKDKITTTMKRPTCKNNGTSRPHDTAAPVIKTPDMGDFNKRYPPIHSDEEIARALQFYEEFGPVVNGAQGPNMTRPYENSPAACPVHFPETTKVTADAYAASSASSASTIKPRECKAVPPVSSVPAGSAASSSSTFSSPLVFNSTGRCAHSDSTAKRLLTMNVESSAGIPATFDVIPRPGYAIIAVNETEKYWYLIFENERGKRREKVFRKHSLPCHYRTYVMQ